MGHRLGMGLAALGIVATAIMLVFGLANASRGGQVLPHAPEKESPPAALDLDSLSERFQAVARKVLPSVVYVEARKDVSKKDRVEESGSGVVIAVEQIGGLYVLTSHHVVAQASAQHILIQGADLRVVRPVRLWADAETDVALLQLPVGLDWPAATLGDSDRVRVGQWVLAMGSPFGLDQTVTHGIVSARGRGRVYLGRNIRIRDFLQTDAAINPGSSGGPLVNLQGEVIGINTAIASPSGSSSGVSFSIPINLCRQVVRELLQRGYVPRGYLGVQLSDSFEPADALQLGLDRLAGAKVELVLPGSPAARAGLQPGDLILDLDGKPLRHGDDLINAISSQPPGVTVTMRLWRAGRQVSVSVTLDDWNAHKSRLKTAR
ncbi:MAG: serine endoprotease [Gemmataceae bacterium]